MGLLFNRKKTGLTSSGAPQANAEQLAALMLGQRGGGGLTGLARTLYARKMMKNASNAREKLSSEGIDDLFGGERDAPELQNLKRDMAELMATNPQPGSSVPKTPGARVGVPMSGTPGALTSMDETMSPEAKSALSGPPEPLQRFQAGVQKAWSPQKIGGLKKMVQSGDPLLRQFAGGVMESLSSKADPSKRYITAGNNIFDAWTAQWIQKPPEDVFKPFSLSAGEERHIPYLDPETMEYKTYTVKNDKDYGVEVALVNDHVDPETKNQMYRYMLISKDPRNPTAMPVLDDNGKVLLTDKASKQEIVNQPPQGARTKFWQEFVDLGHAATMMDYLEAQLPVLEDVLTAKGQINLFWQTGKAWLGGLNSDEFEEYSRKAGAVGVAWDVANKYIKAITGAQMSEREANRLLKAIPNPRDNYAEYLGKLRVVREIIARSTQYYYSLLQDPEVAAADIERRAQEYTRREIDKAEADGRLQELNDVDSIINVPKEFQTNLFEMEGYEARPPR